MPELRNYHIVLSDGTERNIRAKEMEVDEGCVTFSNNGVVAVYAHGAWKMVEVERLDDKG